MDLGLNQTDFARLIGVAQGTLNSYEKGISEPGFSALKGIVQNIERLHMQWLFVGRLPKYLDTSDQLHQEKVNEKMRMIDLQKREIKALKMLYETKQEENEELREQLSNCENQVSKLNKQTTSAADNDKPNNALK
jgi:transcriptional regulator with XRE-family HTH domain